MTVDTAAMTSISEWADHIESVKGAILFETSRSLVRRLRSAADELDELRKRPTRDEMNTLIDGLHDASVAHEATKRELERAEKALRKLREFCAHRYDIDGVCMYCEQSEGGGLSEKWYSSGRGIFSRTGGFQIACMPITVNWQEDTALIVRLLNAGEESEQIRAQLAQVTKERDEAREQNRLLQEQLDETIADGDKAVDALEWYANPNNYDPMDTTRDVARKALASIRGKEEKT